MPDGAANPYLMPAAILHAARLGMEQGLEPPPVQPVGAAPNTDVHIPATLEDALAAFQADKELCAALGEDLVTAFVMLKEAEWKRTRRPSPTRRQPRSPTGKSATTCPTTERARPGNARGAGTCGAGPSTSFVCC